MYLICHVTLFKNLIKGEFVGIKTVVYARLQLFRNWNPTHIVNILAKNVISGLHLVKN